MQIQPKPMDNVRMHLIIEGRVQGVWFRESTRQQAASLGVFGWVQNRPDRTVEVVAEGPEAKVNALISWCRKGPPSAKVTRVTEQRQQWQDVFNSFDVIF